MPPMVDDDAASDSSSLSSVQSPQNSTLDEIRVASRTSFPGSSTFGEGVVAPLASASPAHAIPTPVPADAPIKPKRVRKPKEPKPDNKDEKPKEKKPRKPREPKVKNEDGTAPAPRKRQKKEPATAAAAAVAPDASAGPRQSTLTEMVNQFQTPGPPASAPQPQHILPSQPLHRPSQPDILIRDSLPPASKPPAPRPYSSGQNFDPIRGSMMESTPAPPSLLSNGIHSSQASPQINRASASPSIHSLIDPPSKAAAPLSYSSHTTMHAPQPPSFVGSAQHSPTPPKAAPTVPSQPSPLQQFTQAGPQPQPIPLMDGAMDIDAPTCDAPAKLQPSKSSSSVVTPQVQPKDKKAASPKAAGTGLLASSNLFGGAGAKQETESRGPSIDIRIVLDRDGGNTVNIAQEIFRKYGQDAINPRAAAHRAKLLQVAAAQNKLEGGSADDMSVDLLSDMDGDSNVEMGGMDEEGNPATGADEAKPRKRRKKVEEYDKEDDFIDDTELAWQEAAAVAKDGFFVYSGKLVPEGTTANVESAAPSGRGRGGGRGRGRGRGAATASSSSAAPVADKGKDPSLPARGRGSRGGKIAGATRKPRITKAEKEKLEAEKAERERMIGNHPAGGMPMQMSTTNSATPASLVQPPQQPPRPQHVYTNCTTATGQQSVQAKPLIPT
ncbi:hypothetical protein Slin15195_G127740 [Septoria linicola]|uniref:Hpc2-related domain-containing protein n=1 Tax=Septoria linicola TaxID=215465 RepID=A0A9Q9B723_9PEZI|nr:hypothetical protein Slin14017_G083890 [Septoria linicola]USW59455.1 hypothetical protein Slin15195_G127740 [Septoria linicola]